MVPFCEAFEVSELCSMCVFSVDRYSIWMYLQIQKMRDTVFEFVNSEFKIVMEGVKLVEDVIDIFRFDKEESVVNITSIKLHLSTGNQ